jgi:hypothetical protein
MTHASENPLAPTFEFLRDSLAPQLAAIGWTVTYALARHGFYPGLTIWSETSPGVPSGSRAFAGDRLFRSLARMTAFFVRSSGHVRYRD